MRKQGRETVFLAPNCIGRGPRDLDVCVGVRNSRRDGVVRSGNFAMLFGITSNWGDANVPRHAFWTFAWFAAFLLLMGAWIVATSRAGV